MEFIFTFLEGLASFISPCLLPMLPIYVSYFAGNDKNNTKRAVVNSIGFVFGFTFIFILLSVFASTFGTIIGANIKYIKTIFGIIIIILGLNYMGILKIRFLNRMNSVKKDTNDLDFLKSFLFGMLFSISWTPCIGAFLSSALMLISKEQNVFKGIVLILLYSIGLGIPLVVTVVLMDKLKKTFEVTKNNYRVITIISGIILIIMGFYIIFF